MLLPQPEGCAAEAAAPRWWDERLTSVCRLCRGARQSAWLGLGLGLGRELS